MLTRQQTEEALKMKVKGGSSGPWLGHHFTGLGVNPFFDPAVENAGVCLGFDGADQGGHGELHLHDPVGFAIDLLGAGLAPACDVLRSDLGALLKGGFDEALQLLCMKCRLRTGRSKLRHLFVMKICCRV